MIYWTLIATAGTVGGILALSQWGGFPPPDYRIMGWIAGVQFAYAFLVMIVLLLSRQISIDWMTKIS